MIDPFDSAATTPFLIGVDSDGTVFDSMEIKHKRVFQPLAVEIWNLQALESEFNEIAETINLYSVHRGVNRFQGLVMAFERLAQQTGAGEKTLGQYANLREFVLSGFPMSAASLKAYNEVKRSPFIDQVLEWSKRSDELYAQIMTGEGNPPYRHARSALERLSASAEIMVISSSARDALMQDWGEAGLLPLTKRIAGQEVGDKTIQIRHGLLNGADAEPGHCLMIGDAVGDLEAARANHILFYPILPGAEDQSWERFETEGMNRFLQNTYAGEYQASLLEEFETVLRPDEPWPSSLNGQN